MITSTDINAMLGAIQKDENNGFKPLLNDSNIAVLYHSLVLVTKAIEQNEKDIKDLHSSNDKLEAEIARLKKTP